MSKMSDKQSITDFIAYSGIIGVITLFIVISLYGAATLLQEVGITITLTYEQLLHFLSVLFIIIAPVILGALILVAIILPGEDITQLLVGILGLVFIVLYVKAIQFLKAPWYFLLFVYSFELLIFIAIYTYLSKQKLEEDTLKKMLERIEELMLEMEASRNGPR